MTFFLFDCITLFCTHESPALIQDFESLQDGHRISFPQQWLSFEQILKANKNILVCSRAKLFFHPFLSLNPITGGVLLKLRVFVRICTARACRILEADRDPPCCWMECLVPLISLFHWSTDNNVPEPSSKYFVFVLKLLDTITYLFKTIYVDCDFISMFALLFDLLQADLPTTTVRGSKWRPIFITGAICNSLFGSKYA